MSGKGPAIAKKDFTDADGRGGCYAATADHAILEKMYGKKKTGGEYRIGVPGGRLSGLVIVDCDLYKDEFDFGWYAEACKAGLETGRIHRGNGKHYIFKWVEGMGCPVPAKGVEIKGEGGYVGWPGTDHYVVERDVEPPEMPPQLIDLIMADTIEANTKGDIGNLNDAAKAMRELTASEDIETLRKYQYRRNTLSGYEDWTRLVAGIATTFKGTKYEDEAYSILRKFSLRWEADRADADEIEKELDKGWKGYKKLGGVTMGTVVMLLAEQPEMEIEVSMPSPKNEAPAEQIGAAPGLVGEIAAFHDSKSSRKTPNYGIAAGLIAVSSLLGNRYQVQLEKQRTNTNLFLVVCGPTGSGKEMPRTVVQDVLRAADDLEVLADPASEPGFHQALLGSPRLTWMPDEFGKYLKFASSKAGAHSSNVLKFAMSAYGLHKGSIIPAKVYSNAKDAKPLVDSPYVCIMGTTTVETLTDALTEESVSDGFLNRLLMVQETKEVMRTKNGRGLGDMPDGLRERIARLSALRFANDLRDADKSQMYRGTVMILADDDATALIESIRDDANELAASTNDHLIAGLSPRICENVIRVAGVLAVGDAQDVFKPVITYEHVEWAREFVYQSFGFMHGAAEDLDVDDHDPKFAKRKQTVRTFIEENEDVTRSLLLRKFGKMKAAYLDTVLQDLIDARYIKTQKVEKEGSKPFDVFVSTGI